MNQQTAYAEWTEHGYIGKFQLAWRTDVYVVKKDDKPLYFKYPHDAEIAAWRAKDAIENTVMLRDGVTLSGGKYPEAEAVFSKGAFKKRAAA
ncbi:hypothetical protein [Brucella sp. BO2]|uniref:hypothetical protein n=1 Tax=Brucella sp. BO2 TaxID=693750 RepID=UPI00046CB2F0|nr:hypothetical protein [Brucella sp. BO2]